MTTVRKAIVKRKIKSKTYPLKREGKYKLKGDAVFFGLGAIPKGYIPEIKLSYSRGKKYSARITRSGDAADFLRKVFGKNLELQEYFIVLYLNRANEIIGYYRHTVGAIDSVIADMRIIFATALSSLSTGIILAHNHPSGNARPSKLDIAMTEKARGIGELMNISVFDHIILTKDAEFSFADNGV